MAKAEMGKKKKKEEKNNKTNNKIKYVIQRIFGEGKKDSNILD